MRASATGSKPEVVPNMVAGGTAVGFIGSNDSVLQVGWRVTWQLNTRRERATVSFILGAQCVDSM
jgi:hypothetical protein